MTRRQVTGHRLVTGGDKGKPRRWHVRVDLDDGGFIHYPLPGGFEEPPDIEDGARGLVPAYTPYIVSRKILRDDHGRWVVRSQAGVEGAVEHDAPLPPESARDLTIKVDAALMAIEAALTVEHAKLGAKK